MHSYYKNMYDLDSNFAIQAFLTINLQSKGHNVDVLFSMVNNLYVHYTAAPRNLYSVILRLGLCI